MPLDHTPKISDPYGIRTRVAAVKGRSLNRLTNGPSTMIGNSDKRIKKIWQPATLPGSFPPSTIARLVLNCPVRNGKECDHETHRYQKDYSIL